MIPTRLLGLMLAGATLTCLTQSREPRANAAHLGSASQSPTPPQAPPNALQDANAYVIGADDVLNVTVWKQPTLSGSILVRPDGKISMPLVNDIQASGLTTLQLSEAITAKLRKFIQDPSVSVVLSQVHSKLVYLLGEVNKKGSIELTPAMTLLQAISSAGGLTDYANKKKIYILRTEAGNQTKIPVHYKEALRGKSEFNLVLQPGDTIVVP